MPPVPVMKKDEMSMHGQTIFNGWVRAILAAIGGMLVSKGLLDAHMEASLEVILVPAISGIATIIATGLWSSAEKRLVKLLPPQTPLPEGANPPAG